MDLQGPMRLQRIKEYKHWEKRLDSAMPQSFSSKLMKIKPMKYTGVSWRRCMPLIRQSVTGR